MDLTVEEGSIFGFLGPNGAGKTTMLRLITGLAQPTSGTVQVLGHDVATAGNAVRAEIGFLPDVPGFYEWMTAEEFLRFAGALFGLRGGLWTSGSPCCSTWPGSPASRPRSAATRAA